jgi:prepilin-type processing-associated H-X9-DG protein
MIAQRQPRQAGFTIIETLVVAGIIALIIGMLAPALSSARAAARGARCLLNLRQMATAAHSYAAMYDALPVAIRYDNTDGVFRRIAWDWITTFDNHVISPGPLWGFTNNPGEVQQCPEFEGASTFGGDPYTGYNYNTTYLGGESPFPQVGWTALRKGLSLAQCRRSEQCAMFGDGGWKGGANKFMRAPLNSEHMSLSTLYAGGQAYRHRGGTSVAFVDGHTGSTHDGFAGALATDQNLHQVMNFPRNAFLSNDDAFYDPR